MSDTPRTDDEVRMPEMPPEYCGEAEIVDASFARTLERELAEARAQRDRLAAELASAMEYIPTTLQESARAALAAVEARRK